jgi:hypothetical protein
MSLSAEEQFRKALLPKWIRFFCWLFLIAGTICPALLIVGIFYSKPMSFGLFGWEHIGSPYDIYSLLVEAYFICSGIAAYGLLWGKQWGRLAGLAVGIVGLVVALSSFIVHPLAVATGDGEYSLNLRLEPLFQIPYIFSLWRIRKLWESGLASSAAT